MDILRFQQNPSGRYETNWKILGASLFHCKDELAVVVGSELVNETSSCWLIQSIFSRATTFSAKENGHSKEVVTGKQRSKYKPKKKEEKLLQPLREIAYSCLLILNQSLVLVYSTRLFYSWFLRQAHWQFETESLLITWNQLPQKTLNNIATWFEICAYMLLVEYFWPIGVTQRFPSILMMVLIGNKEQKTFDKFKASKRVVYG